MFSVSKIVSHVAEHPLMEPNRYEVIITGPVHIPASVLFNCNRCDIPGHSLMSFEHGLIGPKRKIPNGEIFEEISTSFYVNHHIEEIKVIDEWITKVGGNDSYRIAYYNDIVGEMTINIYSLTGSLLRTIYVYEVYPVGRSNVDLAYDAELPVEVTVNWAYHSFEIE